jgi:hypothetical protein
LLGLEEDVLHGDIARRVDGIVRAAARAVVHQSAAADGGPSRVAYTQHSATVRAAQSKDAERTQL